MKEFLFQDRTVSGCIGISIAKNSTVDEVTLSDISDGAIDVATKNININNISKKCTVLKSDLLETFIKNNVKFNMIVSNPPYIPTKDIAKLDKEVQKEPLIALDGGNDGMDIYRRILNDAWKVLNNDSYIIFEIGYDEQDKIANIIKSYNDYTLLESIKDLGGNDRVVVCHFLKK